MKTLFYLVLFLLVVAVFLGSTFLPLFHEAVSAGHSVASRGESLVVFLFHRFTGLFHNTFKEVSK